MIILDCILSDEHVDIGRIINKEIKDCVEKRDGFIFFPCLITELCMKQGVQISVEEHQYRQHPQGALSAEMKERKSANSQSNLVQKHLMQKHRAVWKFQQEQHEWLQQRLLEISQLPTVLDTPEFPSWVFEDDFVNEEEEEKEENEEGIKKKKVSKRKRKDEKKRKGKKKKVAESIEELEETDEDPETEEMVKDMEREEDDDSEETNSEHDSELDLTMEEMLRRRSAERIPQQPPQTPSKHTSPTEEPQNEPPSQKQPTPDPTQAETVIPTNPTVLQENLQVINEEPEEGENTGTRGSEVPRADATASGVVAPTAAASQQISREQAKDTIKVVLRELERRKREEAAMLLKGLAEGSGIIQKTPTNSKAVKVTTGEEAEKSNPEAVKEGALQEEQAKEKAVEDPKDNQPSMEKTADTEKQPEEVADQSSAVAPGATAPTEPTGATAPQAAAASRPPKLRVKRAATRASNRLRSGAKPK